MYGQKRGNQGQGFRGGNGFCNGQSSNGNRANSGFQGRSYRRGRGLGICAYIMSDSEKLEQLKAAKASLENDITLLENNLKAKA